MYDSRRECVYSLHFTGDQQWQGRYFRPGGGGQGLSNGCAWKNAAAKEIRRHSPTAHSQLDKSAQARPSINISFDSPKFLSLCSGLHQDLNDTAAQPMVKSMLKLHVCTCRYIKAFGTLRPQKSNSWALPVLGWRWGGGGWAIVSPLYLFSHYHQSDLPLLPIIHHTPPTLSSPTQFHTFRSNEGPS